MKSFHLDIVTPDGMIFAGEAESLLVHTCDGDVEIMAGHMDYMASVSTGKARIVTGGATKIASCSGGFLTVTSDGVILAAVTIEFADSIDVDRAERAKERAEQKLATATDDLDIALAKAKLERALTRIKVAKM